MATTLTIYDWRPDVTPIDQLFTAGGASKQGGATISNVLTYTPAIGGRSRLDLAFAAMVTESANLSASWLMSKIQNSAFRVRLWDNAQLVPTSQLGGVSPDTHDLAALTPAAIEAGYIWRPTAPITAASLAGTVSFTVNLSTTGPVLKIGHVIGFRNGTKDAAHMVDDVTYSGDVATVTVSPPLRAALTTSSVMEFRPSMIAVCSNPDDVISQFKSGRHTTLGAARFIEVVL